MKGRISRYVASFAALGIAAATPVMAAGPTSQDLLNDAATPGDVLTYGMGPQAQRFSTLAKVNVDNVKNMVPAFAASLGGEKQRGQEAQPLVYDGTIYVTGSYSRVFAFDARTGEKKWEYSARLPDGIMPCCDVVNRGAAIHGDKIIFATLDAHLIALNRHTGKVIWNKTTSDYQAGYSATAAPLIVKDMVITGNSGGEFGIIGEVQARNVDTGELIWTRPTIEGNMGTLKGQPNGMTGKLNASWPGDMYKTGGGATWLGGTYDPDTNLIFFGTGNPGPWNSHLRPGDNLYTSSTLAIDPDTGVIKWHYQTTPHDGWDFDGVNEFIPFDATINGKAMKLGAKADRNGYFYVLDRTNGKLVNASKFVMQTTWADGINLKTGRPNYTADGRPGAPSGTEKGKVVFSSPSFLGGKNWMPMAYSKDTGLFYVPSNDWGMDIWNEPIAYKKGSAYLGAGFTIKPIAEDHIGALRAMDPKTGKIVWEYKNKAPLWGGVLTTAGNLVFTGTPEGYLKAFNAKTGEELWKFNTGSGVVGSPITWEQDGEQYVAVMSGWGGAVPLWGGEVAKTFKEISQGGSLWVFKLPKG
ncbi:MULTISPECIES: methanol/ethanol family PQQ-dependent dehydrogenase [unclassified Novosphingobium]|uniref:methanol/ethanol family PQQ-dependent dehydrogenase n=1 Tax=unclassified Novosphingobium TaxID=2644732 RepID=UPI00086CA113|nr:MULTISPECIES: methanol/ethanol family PQQ-dependent dehydrogenase [unclassified Novosphingobium]MBN9143101.1 methanol/ethanol family PQQ-dependent dehydrogenase [Novosphingobium sp.]MDR6706188.1 alcohol dehydrogenase (cytochrome c) [Novosphingobium sp. 1748]NKJ01055.1 alcohol dehydrogenase (cytochrome c) [Novosphingobium sp. SG707]ODU84772.1 MAG: dehydrogenase [Novosphingobium sp. SCN 63-17]OJX89448.1 MAG: dehydrogenase [Novosphingobium sp. 63-713]